MRRLAFLAAGAMLLGGCLAGTADRPTGPGERRSIDDTAEDARPTFASLLRRSCLSGEGGRRGVAVIADDTEAGREAARSLAAALAAECHTESLGVALSPDECLVAARERGLDVLVTCRVIEYDPYDPARLVVGVTLDEAGGSRHMSAREAMVLGRSAGSAASGPSKRGRGLAETIDVDLGAQSKDLIRAYARDAGLGETPDGLLEAEILLRDPARFFPFAAQQIASRIAAAEDKQRPAEGEKSVPVRRPAPRKLGALGRRR